MDAVGGPVRRFDLPVPVWAWLSEPSRQGMERRVPARALAWTPRAGLVEYRDPQGRAGTVWLWASAIERGVC